MTTKSQLPSIDQLLVWALKKDQGALEDVTTNSIVSSEQAEAIYISKADNGVLSGIDIATKIMKLQDNSLQITILKNDGDKINKGDILAIIKGSAKSILMAERVSLEFLRRMSGIATKTQAFVAKTKGTKCQILDTRKISPLWGELDKKAVLDGGGANHRQNLSEMGLIKNNHIDVLNGDIALAIKLFRNKYQTLPLEVEVRNETELKIALNNNPDRIMIDNMGLEETRKSVELRNKINKNIKLESSGNMTLERIADVANTGVDFISVGELTHSVKAFDISLHIKINK